MGPAPTRCNLNERQRERSLRDSERACEQAPSGPERFGYPRCRGREPARGEIVQVAGEPFLQRHRKAHLVAAVQDRLRQLAAKRSLQEMLENLPVADWVRDMIEHYNRTGTYRPQDLRRLLGDPTRCVQSGPNSTLAAHLLPTDRLP